MGRALLWLFYRGGLRSPARYRVRILADESQIDVDRESRTATSSFQLTLDSRATPDDAWTMRWQIQVEAAWIYVDDAWRILRSEAETIAGSRPG